MPVTQAAFAPVLALLKERRWAEAEAALLRLRRGAPFDPYVLFNLGVVQRETGRPQEALTSWRQALSAEPRFLMALVNISALLLSTGDVVEGMRHAGLALAQQPNNPDLLRNLAVAEFLLHHHQAALENADRALRHRPRDPQLLDLRLQCLVALERWAEAHRTAQELLAAQPGDGSLHTLFYALMAAAKMSDWPFITRHLERFQALAARPDARINPLGAAFTLDDPALLLHLARNETAAIAAHPRPPRGWRDGRITVAYLSPNLREHPVAHMLLAVLRGHDRQRVRVLLVDTQAGGDSAVRQQLLALADGHLDVAGLRDAEAAAHLRGQGIDVLVDLAGTTIGGRQDLLAARPCAVQLLWLGCASTTGTGHYDGFVVDGRIAPPGYAAFCSEPLVHLPCCYHPISTGWLAGQEGDGPHVAAGSTLTRATVGLPPDALVVAMLQQPDRVRPPFIDRVVAAVVRQPRAHLWLRVAEASRPAVLAQLAAAGLAAGRVHFSWHFAERADYLQAMRLADVLVDSHPYGGHSTTGEALCMGTPVLAMAGRSIHARVAASMLHELGLGDLVAADHDGLTATLDRLLAEPALLATWHARFAAAAAQPAAARHRRLAAALEDAYEQTLRAAPVDGSSGAA